jgi:hypothetical protein
VASIGLEIQGSEAVTGAQFGIVVVGDRFEHGSAVAVHAVLAAMKFRSRIPTKAITPKISPNNGMPRQSLAQ